MRKYRGLTKERKWVHGSLILSEKGDRAFIGHIRFLEDGMPIASYVEVIPETVGQFTDLHDSTKWGQLTPEEQQQWLNSGKTKEQWNGRKIYEGDVVRLKHGDAAKLHKKLVIAWGKFGFFAKETWSETIGWTLDATDIEVYGTIHENPELLERKEQ